MGPHTHGSPANFTVHTARRVRRAGESITHMQRRRHHVTVRGLQLSRPCLEYTESVVGTLQLFHSLTRFSRSRKDHALQSYKRDYADLLVRIMR